jgi:hypothetical protein
MASITVKGTYSLDLATVRDLEALARRFGVSKSDALRRAIRAAARDACGEAAGPLAALDELQRSLGLTEDRARAWAAAARQERVATSRRREGGARRRP